MRQDQFEKLQTLEEKLVDVFLDEADPEHWPGRGLKLGAMDAKTRGDLYWVRKTAASAAILAQRVGAMIGNVQRGGGGTAPAAGDESSENSIAHQERQMDDDIARAERDAARLIREVQEGAGKKAFDRKTHGST